MADPTGASTSHATSKTPTPPPLLQPHDLNLFGQSEKRAPPELSTSSSSSSSMPVLAPYHLNYPSIQQILELIEADKPGQGFDELKTLLLDAGLASSSQLVLLPEDVLSVVGDMGQKRARILCNYAKRVVLPLLRLQGMYEEPEIVSPKKGKEHAIEGDATMEDGLRQVKDLWDVEILCGQGDEEDEHESDEEEEQCDEEEEQCNEEERNNLEDEGI